MADVTVITPSLPERSSMLAEAMQSVAGQTLQPAAHLIAVDWQGGQHAALRTALVRSALTEWVAFLDDDDLFDVGHLGILLSAARRGADVVIPHCRFDGPPLPPQYYNQPFDRETLRQRGIFPITVLARRLAILAAGGFRTEDRYEDWSLWNRMADDGARFVVVPRVTWTYRTGHPSRTTGDAA